MLQAAFAAGVTVPEPLFACADPAVFGKPFFVMRRASGTAAAHRITRDPTLDPALPAIAERLGQELARIHTIRPPRPDLGFLSPDEQSGPVQQIAGFRAYLDAPSRRRGRCSNGACAGSRRTCPRRSPPVLCHHDFRTGNYLLDGARLTGDPRLGICRLGRSRTRISAGFAARVGALPGSTARPAGSPTAPRFTAATRARAAPSSTRERVRFWEVLASVRWAVIALQQSDRHMLGGERSLDLALTGRRATECELEILMLLDCRERACSAAKPAAQGRLRNDDLPERPGTAGARPRCAARTS